MSSFEDGVTLVSSICITYLTERGASLLSEEAKRYVIFGCRSPLVVDYEESIIRAGLSLLRSVSLNGTPRVLDQSKVMSLT